MTEGQAAEYHKNTLKNIRSALNRHLKDIGRQMDISRDREFREANNMLDAKLKSNMREGLSRPTKHKDIIPPGDLDKISTYLTSDNNPVILRYKVWFDLAIFFVSRALEFHQQLTLDSFEMKHDDRGALYASLTHETRQKNYQGGLGSEEALADKRMYAIPGHPNCPFQSLTKLIEKTDPSAKSLFNECNKEALKSPNLCYRHTSFMRDISRSAKCSKKYTAHCLRSTAISVMSDAGVKDRHICFMTGHRNESSVRSYSRDCSTTQKRQISHTLTSCSSVASESADLDTAIVPAPRLSTPTTLQPLAGTSSNANVALQATSQQFTAGFMSSSSFSNCTFHISGHNPQ